MSTDHRASASPATGDDPFAELVDRLSTQLDGRVQRNAPLGALTTYRVGGSAALLVTPHDFHELLTAAQVIAEYNVRVMTIGRGSNMLVADSGFNGVVIHPQGDFDFVRFDATQAGTTVQAGAAALLPVVARRTVAEGLTGFEWAVGVPGSMGGAARMNAGGHGSDMAASVVSVATINLRSGQFVDMTPAQLDFGYRRSALTTDDCVVSVTLRLQSGPSESAAGEPAVGADLLSEIVAWRREHQPGGQNAGSVFTNPPGDSAGRIIDSLGLKGLRVGSAEVSTKHANFIQADVDGTAADIHQLMNEIMRRVDAETGVRLHPETHLVGFAEPTGSESPATGDLL